MKYSREDLIKFVFWLDGRNGCIDYQHEAEREVDLFDKIKDTL